jgi:archaeosortase B (VPXXXP-CTERM-specific)
MSPDDGAPEDPSQPGEEVTPDRAEGASRPASGGEPRPSQSASPTDSSIVGRVKAAWANPAYRFVMLFLPYLGVVSVGYPALLRYWGGFVQAFIDGTAWIEFTAFSLFTDQVTMRGKMVTYGGFTVTIVDECTGLYEMLIYSAAVLAFPTTWKNKGMGLLMGNPLIYLFNVLRIGMLIFVGEVGRDWFDFMHVYFMQATMIVMITGVWLLWITRVVRDRDIAQA